MRILVVGGGGREHALVWRLARDAERHELLCVPGNPGVARSARCVELASSEVAHVAEIARREEVDLVVVGPEAPLCAGLADALALEGIPAFGPSAAAARLEGSKVFAKEFLARHAIPTAPFGVFSEVPAALAAIEQSDGRLVVKADGLAAGKGVVVCSSVLEARAAIETLLGRRAFGEASARIVVEERLEGREASLMAFVSGERVVALPPAEDHKQAYDGDAGPMTGGMGTISPTPVLDGPLIEEVVRSILEPAARGCVADGFPYHGILYAGLMLAGGRAHVLEFNCRLGDPEAEVVLPRLDGELSLTLAAIARQASSFDALPVSPQAATCVVMAAAGYPGVARKGDPISGIDEAEALEGAHVFHAGTRRSPQGELVTAAGRVLAVTAVDVDLDASRERAYRAVARLHFAGAWVRNDIGARDRRSRARGG